jgi:hypothetical protein
MIKVFRNDTQWAIAGTVATTTLEQLARQLPKELHGDGSKIVEGKEGFTALLVFGDLPDETLARQLLVSVSPVYLLDFDDDAPVTRKLARKKMRVTKTRVNEHPADFLERRGIVAPGYAFIPPTAKDVGLIEGVSLAEAKHAIPAGFDAELREHPRGVLVIDGPVGGMLATKLEKRAYCVYYDREDGWFICVVYDRGQEHGVYSPVTPGTNAVPLDNILGETTLEGILRVLEIPRELLGAELQGHGSEITTGKEEECPTR